MTEYDKEEVVLSVEPTGQYWMLLAASMCKECIKIVVVNPLHIKRTKELYKLQ
jgi:transposase